MAREARPREHASVGVGAGPAARPARGKFSHVP